MSPGRYLGPFFVLGLMLVLAACSAGQGATPTPTPTPPFGLPPLALPQDEAPHDFQTEWWYFNVHLEAVDGRRFALHDVVFQVIERESGRTLYVRHTGLADAEAQHHVSSERFRQEAGRLATEPNGFAFQMGDWLMSGSQGERYELRAGAGNYSYDLALTATASPLLHGARGLVDFGIAGVSYYYSRPRLEVDGTLRTPDGQQLRVTGLAWLDKQWGDFQPLVVGWDWASLHMDDGTDLMVSRLFDSERNVLHYYATVRRPGEEQRETGGDDLVFEPLETKWTSPTTGVSYRTSWRLAIESEGIDVVLRPLVEKSEFASRSLGVTYWEAGVDAIAPNGEVAGEGFIELNWPARIPTP